MKPKLVITVEGGVVQAVNLSPELGEVEVVVMDYDVEGSDAAAHPDEVYLDANGDRHWMGYPPVWVGIPESRPNPEGGA
jgi:hypothetical protein